MRFPNPLVGPDVVLREFRDDDAAMALELSTDPYVPQSGSLPFRATPDEGLAWVARQRGRLAEGLGFSFAVASRSTGAAIGQAGLWFEAPGEFSVGYALVPGARGRGVAAQAVALLVGFAATLDGARRVEARIEPWNTASVRTAERAGFVLAGSTTHEIGGEPREVLRYARLLTPG